MSITVDFGWKTSHVIVGIALFLVGAFIAVAPFMGIFGVVSGSALGNGITIVGGVVAFVGLVIGLTARKKLKGQAQEIDVKFLPKK